MEGVCAVAFCCLASLLAERSTDLGESTERSWILTGGAWWCLMYEVASVGCYYEGYMGYMRWLSVDAPALGSSPSRYRGAL